MSPDVCVTQLRTGLQCTRVEIWKPISCNHVSYLSIISVSSYLLSLQKLWLAASTHRFLQATTCSLWGEISRECMPSVGSGTVKLEKLVPDSLFDDR